MSSVATPAKPPDRVLSIDALRGFDMFWIVGGEELARSLLKTPAGERATQALVNWTSWEFFGKLDQQLEHVPWEGFRFYDLIFPLFLFLVGAVLPFSLGKLREAGEPLYRIYWRIVRRTVLLFVLGLIYYRILQFDWPNQRYAGVLQRIAVCYFFAAILMLHTGVRTQVAICVALLLGYWAILALVPNPEAEGAYYSIKGNLSGYIDRHWLPGKIFKAYYGFGDNEGLLSTLPAIVTALMGALTGQWLRSGAGGWKKVGGLLVAGLLCLGTGYLWSFWFPIIKNIWTSSFVLVAGGWSLLLLALFYAVIDVLKLRRWAFCFVVIGANAITIYVATAFVDFAKMSRFFFGGLAKYSGDYKTVVLDLGVIVIEWLILLFLHRRKIFLRV